MRLISRLNYKYLDWIFDNSRLLVAGTLLALFWANWDYQGYQAAAHPIHFAVNEIAMVFFFAMAAKEIFESFLPGGPLSSLRQAALPVVATVGGMVGPATIYLTGAALVSAEGLSPGWAIPCATDIAFSYMVARTIFGPKHPAVPFLLLLAIADDALGLIILALFYPTGEVNLPYFFGAVGGGVALALLLKAKRLRSFWWYLAGPGVLSWIGFFRGGIHPALALVPVIFCMPHEARDPGIFAAQERRFGDTLNRFEQWWHRPVQLILGLFGFANAGVVFGQFGAVTWLVLAGLILGKPAGILAFSALGKRFGLALPPRLSWYDLSVLGFAASIGFTVSLFISTVAFPTGENLEYAKMGSLLSFAGAPLAWLLASLLRRRRDKDNDE